MEKITFGTKGTVAILLAFSGGGFIGGYVAGSSQAAQTTVTFCDHGESSVGPVTITPTSTSEVPDPTRTGC